MHFRHDGGDVVNDGGFDLLVVNRDAEAYLLRNSMNNRVNWISFRVLNQHGSDAAEAVLKAKVGAAAKRRELRMTYSFLAANDPRIHLGLGDAERVTEGAVRWLNGGIELFRDFDSGQEVTLRRGNGE